MTTKPTAETALAKISGSYQRWRDNGLAIEAAIGDRTEAVMALAFDLAALKQATVSNQAFGAALKAAGYNDKQGPNYLSDNDRSALLKFAEYPEDARTILDKTDRTNLHNIWTYELKPDVEPDTKASSSGDEHEKAQAADNDSDDSKSDKPSSKRYSDEEIEVIEKHAVALLRAFTRKGALDVHSDVIGRCLKHYSKHKVTEEMDLNWYALNDVVTSFSRITEDVMAGAPKRRLEDADEGQAHAPQ